MGKSMVDRFYHCMINDLDYKDLPETEEARSQLRGQVMKHFGTDDEEACKQWMTLENQVEEVACANERQGFIRGIAVVKARNI